jgi:hypothetical protein
MISSKQVLSFAVRSPKTRRRMRKLGVRTQEEAMEVADQNERKEAQWQRETQDSGDPEVRAQRQKKGYRVS